MYQIQPGSHPVAPGSQRPNSGLWIVLLVFGALGSVFAGIGFVLLARVWRAADWPTVPAVITRSEVESRRGSKGGTVYLCKVAYRYEIAGVPRTGTRLDINEVWTSGSGPREDQRRYAAGTTCTVHVNPQNPDDSVVRAEAGLLEWIFAGIGSLFLGIVVLIGAGAWLKSRGPQRP